MTEWMTLNALPVGETLRVTLLGGEKHMQKRLYDLGLCEGTLVSCVGEAPLGDPRAYLVRGAILCLRRCDADRVFGIGGLHGAP